MFRQIRWDFTGFIFSHYQRCALCYYGSAFLSLDYLFERDFKELFRDKDHDFYANIKDMTMEDFIASMMELREEVDPC